MSQAVRLPEDLNLILSMDRKTRIRRISDNHHRQPPAGQRIFGYKMLNNNSYDNSKSGIGRARRDGGRRSIRGFIRTG